MKSMNKFFAVVIIVLWGAFAILNLVLPKKDFSEMENRALTTFPSFSIGAIFDGSYTLQLEQYLNDRVIGRDTWVSLKCYAELAIGKCENGGVYICDDSQIENISEPNEAIVEGNIAGIKRFAEIYDGNVHVMVVPSAAGVQTEKLPNFAITWDQKALLENIGEMLGTEISSVNVFDILREHKDEYIYYRTDHHWTTDGAFYAYQKLAESLDIPQRSLNEFTIKTVTDEFNGTLYSKSGYRGTEPDEIRSYEIGELDKYSIFNKLQDGVPVYTDYDKIFFEENLETKDKYAYFFNSNYKLVTIKTKSQSDRKLLIFKDSYALSMVPMLMEDFSEITLIDPRYYNGDFRSVVNLEDYSDTVFIFSIDLIANQQTLEKYSRLTD